MFFRHLKIIQNAPAGKPPTAFSLSVQDAETGEEYDGIVRVAMDMDATNPGDLQIVEITAMAAVEYDGVTRVRLQHPGEAFGETYLDEIARDIYERVSEPGEALPIGYAALYRMYAVLALSKGVETSAPDVHDAWCAWSLLDRPDHHHIIPFQQLSPEIQKLDVVYRDAIQAVADERDL